MRGVAENGRGAGFLNFLPPKCSMDPGRDASGPMMNQGREETEGRRDPQGEGKDLPRDVPAGEGREEDVPLDGLVSRRYPEVEEEIKSRGIPLFASNVVYRVFEDYQRWVEELREEEKRREFVQVMRAVLQAMY